MPHAEAKLNKLNTHAAKHFCFLKTCIVNDLS